LLERSIAEEAVDEVECCWVGTMWPAFRTLRKLRFSNARTVPAGIFSWAALFVLRGSRLRNGLLTAALKPCEVALPAAIAYINEHAQSSVEQLGHERRDGHCVATVADDC
jgi:hypothetical protein